MKAFHYDDKGYYIGTVDRQRDPLESKLAGHDVWLIPADATDVEPLEEKEGFKVKFDKEAKTWSYEEIEKEEESAPYEPTEEDNLNLRLAQLKYELSQLDYIGIKIATGRATKKEYTEEIARMNELAEEINQVNEQLEALKASEEK